MRNWLYDYRMANIVVVSAQQVAEVIEHNNLMRRLRAEDDARERQRKQDQLFDEVHEMRRLLEQQK